MDWEAIRNEYEHCIASRRWGAALAVCANVLSKERVPQSIRVDWLCRKARVHLTAAPGATGPALSALKEARLASGGDPGSMAKVLVMTIILHRYGGQDPHHAAALLSEFALLRSIAGADQVEKQAGHAYFNAGQLFEEAGRLEEAEYAYTAALQAYQGRTEPEMVERLAWAQDHLGGICLQTGRLDAGRHLIDQAHQVLDDVQYGQYTYKRKAEVALAEGQLEKAEQLAGFALQHMNCDDRARADALLVKVQIAQARGDDVTARLFAEQLAEAATKAGYNQLLEVYYKLLARSKGEV